MSTKPLIINNQSFDSRLLLGTGKFANPKLMAAAIESAGSEIITTAVRRVELGKKSENTSLVWNDIIGHVKKYIFTKFITSSITGVAAGLIYWFLGLELAFIFGSLTFILNFIPVVGSIIAVLLPIPIAILQYSDLSSVLLIIFLPAIIHQIIGNVVEPKIFGDAFGLHPITIILSLIFWGMIWGIIGVLLAAPLTAIIRVTFERFDSTRQIARLLEGKVHLQD